MTLPNGDNLWKLWLGIQMFAFFLCLGIAHVINPDHFIKHSAIRKGGKMLSDWNRDGVRVLGVIVAIFAGFGLYMLLGDRFGN